MPSQRLLSYITIKHGRGRFALLLIAAHQDSRDGDGDGDKTRVRTSTRSVAVNTSTRQHERRAVSVSVSKLACPKNTAPRSTVRLPSVEPCTQHNTFCNPLEAKAEQRMFCRDQGERGWVAVDLIFVLRSQQPQTPSSMTLRKTKRACCAMHTCTYIPQKI